MTVVLIGPMGAGKTSVGRRVARALEVPFADTDALITRAHGPIETIFATAGEVAFRAWEREAVEQALAGGGVVALGGGAVLDPATRSDLASHRVVLLTVGGRTVESRIRDTNRPLLADGDAVARWREIYAARRPLYEQLADVTFDTSRGPLQDIVTAVAAWARDADDDIESRHRPDGEHE
jgi:shikimate kinase